MLSPAVFDHPTINRDRRGTSPRSGLVGLHRHMISCPGRVVYALTACELRVTRPDCLFVAGIHARAMDLLTEDLFN